MDEPRERTDARLGFLAAFSPTDNVFLGGLLVTNRLGRPLEFQCTAPVEPNPTQVLLYGPTLKSYVLGDLIGKTLLERVSTKPHVVLVDVPELLTLRKLISQPLGWVHDDDRNASPSNHSAVESAVRKDMPSERGLRIGRQCVVWNADSPDDGELLQRYTENIPQDADILEPFTRVRAALQEAVNPSATRSTHSSRGAA